MQLCLRSSHKGDAFYVLSGVAIRLARKMGLHRDGSSLGLRPFETEMRRRLWWHLVAIDFRISDVIGTRPSLDLSQCDTSLPLNVDDDNLSPTMTSAPTERNGIVAISFSLIKCEMSEKLRKMSEGFGRGLRWDVLSSAEVPRSQKENIIHQLRDYFEQRYLRYFDPTNPYHMFLSVIIRSGVCKMKLFAYRQQQQPNTESTEQIDTVLGDEMFANAVKLLEFSLMLQPSNTFLSRFGWQGTSSNLWINMLYVLNEVRQKKVGPEVDKAWHLIGQVFSNYPEMFQEQTAPVYIALGKWTLDVWDECATAAITQNKGGPAIPQYILNLRNCRKATTKSSFRLPTQVFNLEQQHSFAYGTPESLLSDNQMSELPAFETYTFPDFQSFQVQGNDWAQWEQMFESQANYR